MQERIPHDYGASSLSSFIWNCLDATIPGSRAPAVFALVLPLLEAMEEGQGRGSKACL